MRAESEEERKEGRKEVLSRNFLSKVESYEQHFYLTGLDER
jgi:hypothetical protein